MRRRKKAPEEHDNHERWLISYADFITLLFAFFVVMYSISSVNEGKYRVLSDSLGSAFKSVAAEPQLRLNQPPVVPRPIKPAPPKKPEIAVDAKTKQRTENMRQVAQALQDVGYTGAIDYDHIMRLTADQPEGRAYIAYCVGYMRAILQSIQ